MNNSPNDNFKVLETKEDEYNLDEIPLDIYPSAERASVIDTRNEEIKASYFTQQPRSQTIGAFQPTQNVPSQFSTNSETQQENYFDCLFELNEPTNVCGGQPNYYATYNRPEVIKNPFDNA